MEGIKVDILEFIDESQPGWVKCVFYDAYGKECFVIEKVPIVTDEFLDSQSEYPKIGFIAGKISDIRIDNNSRTITTIDLNIPWGVSDVNGQTLFDVYLDQIVQINV